MDGVSRACGVGATVELGGRSWTLRGRTVEFYGLMEAEIIKQRGDPFVVLTDAARNLKEDRNALNNLAGAVSANFRNWNSATYADYAQFWGTPCGDAFRIWAAIRDQDASLSPRQVQFWLMEMMSRDGAEGAKRRDEMLDAIDQASGVGTLGN